MEVWIVTEIDQDLDGSNYISVITQVFSTEVRARDYFNGRYDVNLDWADEIIDEENNGDSVVFYIEDSTPQLTKLLIEKKEMM